MTNNLTRAGYIAFGISLALAAIAFLIVALTFSDVELYIRALLLFGAYHAVRSSIAALTL